MGTAPLRSSSRSTAACRSSRSGFPLRRLRLFGARRAAGARATPCRRPAAERTAAGNSARRVGSRSPAIRSLEQLVGGDPHRVGVPAAVDPAAAQRACAHPPHELRQVGDRVRGDVGAGARGAKLAQDAGIAANVARFERFGAVGRHDRVEHERGHVARVGLRVVARRPSCRRRCRTARAFHSRPPDGSPRCRRRSGGRVVSCVSGPSCAAHSAIC